MRDIYHEFPKILIIFNQQFTFHKKEGCLDNFTNENHQCIEDTIQNRMCGPLMLPIFVHPLLQWLPSLRCSSCIVDVFIGNEKACLVVLICWPVVFFIVASLTYKTKHKQTKKSIFNEEWELHLSVAQSWVFRMKLELCWFVTRAQEILLHNP